MAQVLEFEELMQLLDAERGDFRSLAERVAVPRYNVAPTQEAIVLANDQPAGSQETSVYLTSMRWGLIPSWAKDASIGARLINARGETLSEKPSFRSAFKNRRCIVPASGFYEWKAEGGAKTPYYIQRRDSKPLLFAGLWESWRQTGLNELRSFTIVTTDSNADLAPIHNRMPVIFDNVAALCWLDQGSAAGDLQALLVPPPNGELESHVVSRYVNSVTNDGPQCIEAVGTGKPRNETGQSRLGLD
jgi:putative SOS response-associated peptidase YedK